MEILAIILGLLIVGAMIMLPVVLLCGLLNILIELTIKFEEFVGFLFSCLQKIIISFCRMIFIEG